MDKLVSINIATYNRSNLLPRCLDSVLRQSYKNTEVIVVDDCSNDNTREVVERYQALDSRIKYIRHDVNKKLPSARNTAWSNSKGEYIAFMDDDDEWLDNDKIKKQVDIFEKSNNEKLCFICSSVRLYSSQENYVDKIINKPNDLIGHILGRNGIMYTPTVMAKRSIIAEVGGFDTRLARGIDSEFYRTGIVKFGYDVHFMEDVTTGIHEYGDDRITTLINFETVTKLFLSNLYLFKKYNYRFIRHPRALLIRIRAMQVILFRYLFSHNSP